MIFYVFLSLKMAVVTLSHFVVLNIVFYGKTDHDVRFKGLLIVAELRLHRFNFSINRNAVEKLFS